MPDKVLYISVVLLFSIGLFFNMSLSIYIAIIHNTTPYTYLNKQALAIFLGILLMWGLSRLNPDKWFNLIGMVLFMSSFSFMFLMPFLPDFLVKEVGGAKRWIQLGPLSLAPVEFFKVGFVYFLAWSFARRFELSTHLSLWEEIKRFVPYLFVFAVVVVLIAVMQNDLGQVMVLTATLSILILMAGSSARFFMVLIGLGLLMTIFFIITSAHRIERFKSYWLMIQNWIVEFLPNDISKALHVNVEEASFYQIDHSLNAIVNGGWIGTGIGNGTFKLGFLSEVHTDFVLAGIAEESGVFGLFLIVFLFLIVLHRILRIGNRGFNKFYLLFSVGIAMIIATAFLINAYGVSGIIPIKGIAVPFLSYGGSHILATSIAIGMMLMISKRIKG
jgi:cell division protein FtsW